MNRIVKEGDLFESMKEQLRQLPWMLLFILALIQLTRPILSTAGFFDNFRPQGPIIATALIALIWIGVAVVGHVRILVKVLQWLVLLMRLSVLLWLFSCKRFLHGAPKKRCLFLYYLPQVS